METCAGLSHGTIPSGGESKQKGFQLLCEEDRELPDELPLHSFAGPEGLVASHVLKILIIIILA